MSNKLNQNGKTPGEQFTSSAINGAALAVVGFVLNRVVVPSFEWTKDRAYDHYIRVMRGIPLIVLGSSATGKSTLLKRLALSASFLNDMERSPTTEITKASDMSYLIDRKSVTLKPKFDIPGDDTLQDAWVKYFRQVKPYGILFLMDHTDPSRHVKALNTVVEMLETKSDAKLARNIRAFTVLLNKHDLWKNEITKNQYIKEHFTQVGEKMLAQSANLGYKFKFEECSLITGYNVDKTLQEFIKLCL